MKEFANGFYDSPAWRHLRKEVYNERKGLCEVCLKKGLYKPAKIVHHVIWLNAENITDESISLNKDNLMLVCKECHEHLHRRKERFIFDEDGNIIPME